MSVDIKLIKERLAYNENTGDLIWKNGRNKNKVAGGTTKSGYLCIYLQGKMMQAHRVAWAMFYNKFPEKILDHINRNKKDNRICNLREISKSGNAQNRSRSSNKLGVIGVNMTKEGKYFARITVNYKSLFLGVFDTKEEAGIAYKNAKINIHPFFN